MHGRLLESFLHWRAIMSSYTDLCKVKIALFSASSAVPGYVLASPQWGIEFLFLTAGVFVLACGAGALNQYQEREIDKIMGRTSQRPLPSKRIKPRQAFYLSLVLILAGLMLLLSVGIPAIPALGLFSLIWYNGVYTHLKKVSAFAIIPGALTGAIPPYLGWVVGGGAFPDPQVLALCFFFFLWQIPHFWLLLLRYCEEYEQAGIPSFSRTFTRVQLKRITFTWMFAVAVACTLIPLFGSFSLITNYSLIAAALWLCWNAVQILNDKRGRYTYQFVFKRNNLYMLIVMSFLTLGRL